MIAHSVIDRAGVFAGQFGLVQLQLDQLADAAADRVDALVQRAVEGAELAVEITGRRLQEGIEALQFAVRRGELAMGLLGQLFFPRGQLGGHIGLPEPLDFTLGGADIVAGLVAVEQAVVGLVHRVDDVHRVEIADLFELLQRHHAVVVQAADASIDTAEAADGHGQ